MDETLAQLRELLARAIRLDGAQLGNIQLYDPSTKTLRIVVHEGFDQRFLSHFAVVNAFDSSACGRAAGVRSPIVIADVASDPAFKPHLAVAEAAGFRAVKSVPIVGADGRLLGILSTHAREPRHDWYPHGLRTIDLELAAALEMLGQLMNAPS